MLDFVKLLGGFCLVLDAGLSFLLLKNAVAVFRRGGFRLQVLMAIVVPFFLALLAGVAFNIYRVSFSDPSMSALLVLVFGVIYMGVAAGFIALLHVIRRLLVMRTSSSEQLRAEAVVKQSEQDQRLLQFTQFAVDHVPDAALWVTPERRLLYFNPALSALTGYSDGDLAERLLLDWLPDIPDYWFVTDPGAEPSGSGQADLLLMTESGQQVPVDVQYWRFRERQGNYIFLIIRQSVDPTPSASLIGDSASIPVVSTAEIQSAVEEVQHQCRLLINQIPDMLLIYTLDGVIVEANAAVCNLLGYEREVLLNTPMKVIDQNYVVGSLWQAKLATNAVTVSTVYQAQSGDSMQVETRLSLVEWEGETMILAIARNDMVRVLKETELRNSELTLRTLFDSLSHPVLITDLFGKLVDVNTTTLKYFAVPKPKLLEKNVANLLELNTLPEAFAVLWRKVDSGVPQTVECRVKRFAQNLTFPAQLEIQRITVGSRSLVIVELQDRTDVDKIRQSLQIRQEQFRLAVDLANIGFSHWDVPTKRLYWSDVLETLFGLEAQTFDGTYETFMALIHPDDRRLVEQQIQRSLEECLDFAVEFRLAPDVDISDRWLKMQSVVVADQSGRVVRMVQAVQDVTLAKQQEEALLHHESRWRAWVQNSSDLIMQLGEDGVIRYVSPSVEQILGYPSIKVAGSNLIGLVHSEDRSLVKHAFDQMLSNPGQSVTVEYRYRHQDGSWRYLESRGCNLLVREDVGGIVLNTRDVTDRRSAEEALRRSEEHHRMLFEQSPVGLVLCSLNGQLLDLNQAYADITGYSVEELLEQTYWALTPECYSSQEESLLSQIMETGHYGPYEKEYIHKDGHLVPVRLSGILIEQNGNRYIWSSVEDISEAKLTARALSDAEATHRALLTALPDLLLYLTSNGTCLQVGGGTDLQHFVPDAETWTDQSILDWLPGEFAQALLDAVELATTTSEMQIFERSVFLRNCTYFWEARVVPTCANKAMVIVRNVTERITIASVRQQYELTKQVLLEAVPDRIVCLDRSGAFLDLIPAMQPLECVPDPQQTIFDVMPEEIAARRLAVIQQVIETQVSITYQQNLEVEGQFRREEIRVIPFTDESVLCLIQEVPNCSQVGASVESGCMRELLWVADYNGTVAVVSEVAAELYGYSVAEMIGKSIRDLESSGLERSNESASQALIDFSTIEAETEISHHTKDGEHVTLLIQPCTLRGSTGEVQGIAASLTHHDDRALNR